MKCRPRRRFEGRGLCTFAGLVYVRVNLPSYRSPKSYKSSGRDLGETYVNEIRTVGKATGHPCTPRTHPLCSPGMPSHMSDAHLGGLSSGVGRMKRFTTVRTSEYLCPGRDPSLKINHNANLRSNLAYICGRNRLSPRISALGKTPTTGTIPHVSGCVILSISLTQAWGYHNTLEVAC